jgi:hypothetical protein
MTTFKQKKARAKKAPRPSTIVTVTFDFGLAAEREALMAEITEAAKDARAGFDPTAGAQEKLNTLNESESDSLIRVKLYRTDSRVWAKLAAANGYDLIPTAIAATIGDGERHGDGRIIDGKDELEQTPEEWDEFFSLLAPSDFTSITVGSAALNEREPQNRVERLKKLSAGLTGSNGS